MNKILKFFWKYKIQIILWAIFVYALVIGSCYFYVEEQYWVVAINMYVMFDLLKDARKFIKKDWK